MCSEAPKTVDAFEKLHEMQTSCSSMLNNYAWIFFRLLSHGMVSLPSGYEANDTAIPFWSRYQSLIAEKHAFRTVVRYAPIVDAKPSDMFTVYTVMKKCTDRQTDRQK